MTVQSQQLSTRVLPLFFSSSFFPLLKFSLLFLPREEEWTFTTTFSPQKKSPHTTRSLSLSLSVSVVDDDGLSVGHARERRARSFAPRPDRRERGVVFRCLLFKDFVSEQMRAVRVVCRALRVEHHRRRVDQLARHLRGKSSSSSSVGDIKSNRKVFRGVRESGRASRSIVFRVHRFSWSFPT